MLISLIPYYIIIYKSTKNVVHSVTHPFSRTAIWKKKIFFLKIYLNLFIFILKLLLFFFLWLYFSCLFYKYKVCVVELIYVYMLTYIQLYIQFPKCFDKLLFNFLPLLILHEIVVIFYINCSQQITEAPFCIHMELIILIMLKSLSQKRSKEKKKAST